MTRIDLSNLLKSNPQKRRWRIFLGVFISLLSITIMGVLVHRNIDLLKAIRKQITIWPLLTTIPVYLVSLLIASVVWGRMMNFLAPTLPLQQHFKIYVITNAARRFPGTLWHVIGRVAWYKQWGVPKRITSICSLLETIFITWTGLIMALFTFPLASGLGQNTIIVFITGIILISVVMHPRVLGYLLRRILGSSEAVQISFRYILSWLGFYLALWFISGTIVYLIIRSFLPVSLAILPVSIGAASISGVAGMIILILPAGFGLTEATLSLILSAHIPSSIAVMVAITFRICLTLYEILSAIFVYWFSDRVPFLRS